jgi:arylsulfatase A-like enzyme
MRCLVAMCRRIVVVLVLSIVVALSAAAVRAAERAAHPNILFLIADEFRADCLGVAGHPIVKTPHLDALARSGARFTNAYAASPVCSPDRAVLFTGRYPHINGVTRNNDPFNKGEMALPPLLRHYGYVTGMAGKLHLQDDQSWWDAAWKSVGGGGKEYQTFLNEKMPDFRGRSNTTAAAGTLIQYPAQPVARGPIRVGTSPIPDQWYEEAWLADRAIEFLQRQAGSGKPWLMFLSTLKPHSEFVIPEPYATIYKPADMPLPPTFDPHATEPLGGGRVDGRLFINDPGVLRQVIAHYLGAITMVDHHMGRVLEALQKLGMADSTIVVFTADHGNMLGERDRMFKGVMYEGSARVPLLLRAPGQIEAGTVVDAVCDAGSVMPTLLELAHLPIPQGIQAPSLVQTARGRPAATPTAFSELRERMVRRGPWKLILPYLDKSGKPELYNLADDPQELQNLYGRPEVAAAQRELEAALEKWAAQKPPAVTW